MAYAAVTGLSHVGLIRDHNEDSLVIGPWTACATVTESPQTLLFAVGTPLVVAVADGLGGHPGGEVASSLVVRELALAGAGLENDESIRGVLDRCQSTIHRAADRNVDLVGMGTTVAGLVVTADRVSAFNVGDSRVYALAGEQLRQISTDDRPPLATDEDTTSVVTQVLGGWEFGPLEPHIAAQPFSSDTQYLVCTDGVSDFVADDDIGRILRDQVDGGAAYELWKAAMEAGGLDNITIALVRFAD